MKERFFGTSANSEGLDQTVHLQSDQGLHCWLTESRILQKRAAKSKAEQTEWLCRLVWIFSLSITLKTQFPIVQLIFQ